MVVAELEEEEDELEIVSSALICSASDGDDRDGQMRAPRATVGE